MSSGTEPSSADGEGDSLGARLKDVPVCTALDILRDRSPEDLLIRHAQPVVPPPAPFAGRARTVRFLPLRSDRPTAPLPQASRHLIETCAAGDVLVFDTAGGLPGSVLGDMLALRAAMRGAAGVVTDGYVRDVAELKEIGMPVFARGLYPISYHLSLIPWEVDVPIQCGGVLVLPGDWILADHDGAIVLPDPYARQVAEEGPKREADDMESRARMRAGRSLAESYPLPKKN